MRTYIVTVTQTFEVDAESEVEAEAFLEENIGFLEPDTFDVTVDILPRQDRREAA